MFIGWMASSLSMLLLLMWSNLDRVQAEVYYTNENNEKVSSLEYQPADDAPSIEFLSLAVSLFEAIDS